MITPVFAAGSFWAARSMSGVSPALTSSTSSGGSSTPASIDWRSTSRPLSLKMPFSNAYHGSQSSALMLLYAAVTFVQHGRVVGEGEPAAACVGEVDAPLGPAPPPQPVARIAKSATRAA